MTLKMAVLAPIPRANVIMAMAAKAGFLKSRRMATRRFVMGQTVAGCMPCLKMGDFGASREAKVPRLGNRSSVVATDSPRPSRRRCERACSSGRQFGAFHFRNQDHGREENRDANAGDQDALELLVSGSNERAG